MRNPKSITEPPRPVNSEFRCGAVALAGRSNVGKSTLLNRLVGTKVAIETELPQATRSRVLGIRNLAAAQIIWTDLPGLHRARSPLNVRMVETARRSIAEAHVVLVVIDALAGFVAADAEAARFAADQGKPWLMAVNKIDRSTRSALLPLLGKLQRAFPGLDLVPVSARTGENLPELERTVASFLPVGPAIYPEDELTDQTERALVQEFVREKIFEVTGDEVPYRTAVVIDAFTEKPERGVSVVQATILVERDSQKRILIGKGGSRIREIGQRARRDLEATLGVRLYLELHVKVKRDWTRSPRALNELGL